MNFKMLLSTLVLSALCAAYIPAIAQNNTTTPLSSIAQTPHKQANLFEKLYSMSTKNLNDFLKSPLPIFDTWIYKALIDIIALTSAIQQHEIIQKIRNHENVLNFALMAAFFETYNNVYIYEKVGEHLAASLLLLCVKLSNFD